MQKIDEKYLSYAKAVLSGEIVANEFIKLAATRYLNFLQREDIIFKPSECERVLKFVGKFKHFTGSHYGANFKLEEWQKFIIYNIYGFYWKDSGKRVTTNVYVEVARKNGKTALISILSLYALIGDREQNAQVILAATSAKQAKICYDMCASYLKQIDPKNKYFQRYRDNIKFNATDSTLFIVAADATKLDGYNASFFVCDELHEHPSGDVYNVLKSSQGSRKNPLAICITTAGFNKESFCYNLRESYIDILRGNKHDDSQFTLIYTLDDTDDYNNSETWKKSNPNLGVTIEPDFLKSELLKAKNNPTQLTPFLTKNLNVWTQTIEQWLTSENIKAVQEILKLEDFVDYPLYMGVDLGATGDLTALAILCEKDDILHIWTRYYLPSDCLKTNTNKDLYKKWAKGNYLTINEGNVTDYDYILNDILKISENNTIAGIYYDAWNATQFAISATENNLPIQPFSQSIGSINRPTKELARLILKKEITLNYNPIDNFCFGNVSIKRDANENERPTKTAYKNKIDGVMAIINGLGGYLTTIHGDFTPISLNFSK